MSSIEGFRDALLGTEVRIELGQSFNLTTGASVHTARLYTRKPGGRWTKVNPLLLPKDGGDRADLLSDLAAIARGPLDPA